MSVSGRQEVRGGGLKIETVAITRTDMEEEQLQKSVSLKDEQTDVERWHYSSTDWNM